MSGYFRSLALLALLGFCGGCAGMAPNWQNPGTLMQQRNRAVVHDPYVDNDLGPEIPSVRPRQYDQPLAEPERSRVFRDSPFFQPHRPLPGRPVQ